MLLDEVAETNILNKWVKGWNLSDLPMHRKKNTKNTKINGIESWKELNPEKKLCTEMMASNYSSFRFYN